MNKRTIILASAFALFFISCNKKTLTVTPIEKSKYTGQELVYSLPRNVIHVKVDVTKTSYIPGPYASFAKKFLGISNAIQEKSDQYAITGIEISKTTETDPNALFVAFDKKRSIINYFDVATSGLILPIDNFKQTILTAKNIDGKPQPETVFTDLTSTAFIGEEQSVYYSKVAKDSSFVRVPIQKKMIVERNMEEKAKEAAEFIFSLRKKRTEFFINDVETPFDGAAIKAIFDEIDHLEESYLTLFIGKTMSETKTEYFSFTPSKPEGETTILFRYSASKGIVGANDFSGNPVLLEIKPEAVPESHKTIASAIELIEEKKKNEYIYYRIPLSTTISITDGKKEFISQREFIYQYGTQCMIPLSQIKIGD